MYLLSALRSLRNTLLLLVLFVTAPAMAGDTPPAFARYKPLYPGLYFTGSYQQDDRDSVYRQDGTEVDTTAPNAGGTGKTAFPETRYQADFTWFFPMWEADDFPFFSSRLHTARVHLRHSELETTGRLAQFSADASDDTYTEADKLENNGSGIGDLVLEFGSVLFGSSDWRRGPIAPLSMTALIGLTLPLGENNRDAPVSSGDNRAAFHAQLGAHWQPWTGGFADGGVTHREFFQNYDAQFGQLAPTEQGDELAWDLSFAQRVFSGFYLGAFADRRKGDPNEYENPRFAPNAPPPEGDGSSQEPVPGLYRDGGTQLTRYGLAAHYFITQKWLAGLYYTRPQSGKSGEFSLPFENHNPGGCTQGSPTCTITPGATILVDGLGSARSFANDFLQFTLTYSFGQGDTFTCRGCESN